MSCILVKFQGCIKIVEIRLPHPLLSNEKRLLVGARWDEQLPRFKGTMKNAHYWKSCMNLSQEFIEGLGGAARSEKNERFGAGRKTLSDGLQLETWFLSCKECCFANG